MATQTTTSAFQTGLDIQIDGYDKFFKWALRSSPVYRQFVTQYPVDPTNRSRTYHLPKFRYFEAGTRTLTETGDGTEHNLPPVDDVPISLVEYGNRTKTSYRLRDGDATYIDIDPTIAKQLSTDAVDTLDGLVRDAMLAGTQVVYSNAGAYADTGSTATLDATDVLTGKIVRRVVRDLRQASVMPLRKDKFGALISPASAVDLREDAGPGAWVDPHQYVDTQHIYNGEVGTFEGAIFMETPRAYFANDGATAAEVHRTLFLGQENTAEAVLVEPFVGLSPRIDAYDRDRGIYWRADLGHAIYRQEAILRVEHGVAA